MGRENHFRPPDWLLSSSRNAQVTSQHQGFKREERNGCVGIGAKVRMMVVMVMVLVLRGNGGVGGRRASLQAVVLI